MSQTPEEELTHWEELFAAFRKATQTNLNGDQ